MEGWRGAIKEVRIIKTSAIEITSGEFRRYFKGEIRPDEDMSLHTTLRIGGPADLFAIPEDVLSLKYLLVYLSDKGIPVTPIGGGSNLLISDIGIDGCVISSLSLKRIEIIERDRDNVRLFVESGTSLQTLLNISKKEGFSGLEGLAGIPGSLGGAIRGNAGSYGIEIGDLIESIAFMDTRGNISIIKKGDIGFGYRSSRLPEGFILSAILRMAIADPRDVASRMDSFVMEKKERQPVSERSAGCVFKNPEGRQAGRLIDEAGCKGMRRGDIEVSMKHANFFINRGKGRASDFLSLMDEVKERVFRYCGIELEPEIRIIGKRC